MRVAPATRPAMIAPSPTEPAPKTASDAPGLTPSVYSTDPAPVGTPQPSGASSSSGRSPGTSTAELAWASA